MIDGSFGFTPYFTAAVWYGYDINETIEFNGRNPAGIIWSTVMKEIHKDLPSKKFTMPDKIQTYTICRKSGKIANEHCIDTYTEYYLEGTAPSGNCTIHSSSNKGKKRKKNTVKNDAGETSNKNLTSSEKTDESSKDEESLDSDIEALENNNNSSNTNNNADEEKNTNNTQSSEETDKQNNIEEETNNNEVENNTNKDVTENAE